MKAKKFLLLSLFVGIFILFAGSVSANTETKENLHGNFPEAPDVELWKVTDGFYQDAANYATSSNFYITNKEGLKFFRDWVNGKTTFDHTTYPFSGKTVFLLADIEFDENEYWIPIGYCGDEAAISNDFVGSKGKRTFAGVFNGNNHIVSNLHFVDTLGGEYSVGFFGCIKSTGTQLKNLRIKDVNFSSTGTGAKFSKACVGAVVGHIYNQEITIENCHVSGSIYLSGLTSVGGIAGLAWATAKCTVNGDSGSTIYGKYYSGGLLGYSSYPSSATISGEDDTITVSGITISSPYSAGSIVGFANNTTTLDNITVGDDTVVKQDNENVMLKVGNAVATFNDNTYYISLAAAINAAWNGGRVELLQDITLNTWSQNLRGTPYNRSSTEGPTGLTIEGGGYSLSITDIPSGGNGDTILYNPSNFTVQNLTINLPTSKPVSSDPVAFTFRDNHKATIKNVTFNGGRYALVLGKSNGEINIENCTFQNQYGSNKDAFYTENTTNLSVKDCIFDNSGVNLHGSGITFTKNYLKNCPILAFYSTAQAQATYNDFSGVKYVDYNSMTTPIDLSGNYWPNGTAPILYNKTTGEGILGSAGIMYSTFYTQSTAATSGIPFTLSNLDYANKTNLVIKANDQTIDYGGTIATGITNCTIAGLLAGDTLSSVTLAANAGYIIPSGAVVMSGDTDVTNKYKITYENGILTINNLASTISDASISVTKGQSKTISINDTTGTGTRTWALSNGYPTWISLVKNSDSEATITANPPVTIESKVYTFYVTVTNSNNKTSTAQISITVNGGVTSNGENKAEGTYAETPSEELTTVTTGGNSITTTKTDFKNGTAKIIGTEIAITTESTDLAGILNTAFSTVISVDVSVDVIDPDFKNYNYSLDISGLPENFRLEGDITSSDAVINHFLHVFRITGNPTAVVNTKINIKPNITVSSDNFSLVSIASKDVNLIIEAQQTPEPAIPPVVTPEITTTSLPDGTVGQSYTASISANISADWTVDGLPEEFNIAVNGNSLTIFGTPATAGTFTLKITAQNSAGSVSKILDLTIAGTSGSETSVNNTTLNIPDGVTIDEAINNLNETQKQTITEVQLTETQKSSLTNSQLSNIIDTFSSLTTLDLSNCENITSVDLKGKETVTSINLENCSNLTEVNLSGCSSLNEVKGLNGNTNVTQVDTSGCSSLEELDVSNCTALLSLDCSLSSLGSLNVDGCTSLQSLNCQSNSLKELKVDECTELTTLNCGSNNISSLSVKGCLNLQRLYCYSNNLETLEVPSKRLEWLVCDDNKLLTLSIEENQKLQRLDCQNNSMGALDIDTSVLTDLEWLKCYGQNISDLIVSQNSSGYLVSIRDYVFRGSSVALSETTISSAVDTNKVVDVKGYDKNGNEISSSYDSQTGVATFALSPVKVTYTYKTGFNDVDLDVTVGEEKIQNKTAQSGSTTIGSRDNGCSMNIRAMSLIVLAGLIFKNYRRLKHKIFIAFGVTLFFFIQPAFSDVSITAENFPDENFRSYVATELDKNNDGSLSDSEITSVNLIRVDGKDIANLSGIEYFTALEQLYCYNNNLEALDISKNAALLLLECDGNKLSKLDLSKNVKLINLECEKNNLAELSLIINSDLTYVKCYDQKLYGLEISERDNVYAFNIGKYVANLANITEVIAYNASGDIISGVSFDKTSGVVTMPTSPANIKYGYQVNYVNDSNLSMDVTIMGTAYEEVTKSDNSSSGSGGCSSGWSIFALAALLLICKF